MEQISDNEKKKPEQEQGGFHLDLSGTSPQERREIFLKLLGLSENATEADMIELVKKEHKEFDKNRGEFNLEDYKKKEGPVGEGSEERQRQLENFGKRLENIGNRLENLKKEAAATPKIQGAGSLIERMEIPPSRVKQASELIVGKKYRIHTGPSKAYYDVVVDAVPYPKGDDFYVRVRSLMNGATDEKSCRSMSVVPDKELNKEGIWSPHSSWIETLVEPEPDEDEGKGAD